MTNQSPAILTTRNLTKSVDLHAERLQILKQADLSVHEGESLAIVGESGSGKSTLLGILAGLDTPSSGEVTLLNHRLDQLDEDGRAAVRAKHVGFVFQSFQLLPNLTALENVMLPLEILGSRQARQRATELLEQVNLSHRLKHYPNQLSGGEQQRVAVARAFATEPAILFADEPTGNLDSATGQLLIEQLFAMNRAHHTTLVLVTHDASLAERCQRRVTMDAGVLSE